MKQKIVAVVGGTGFLGRYVVKELVRAGFGVRVICRVPESEDALALKPMGDVGQVAVSRGDITNAADIKRLIEDAEPYHAVVNLVGLLFERGRQNFAAVHAQGAERLAKAAKANGAKHFVQMSALGVDRAASSKYARTKLMGEKAVQAAFPEATILRPSIVFGPEDNFFNQFAGMARMSPWLPLIGGGKTRFQPVYAGDVAKAVRAALEMPAAQGQVYELAGPKTYTFRDILTYILKETGRSARLVDLPFPVASMIGRVVEWSPCPPLTHDQVVLLQTDNVVAPDAKTFSDLCIVPTPVETVVPEYLRTYRVRQLAQAA